MNKKEVELVRDQISRMMEVLGVATLPQLSKKIGTSRTNLDNWVKRGTIPINNFLKVSEISGADIEWLKTGKGDKIIPGIASGVDTFTHSLLEKIELIKTFSESDESFKTSAAELFMQIEIKINEAIAKQIVKNLLKEKENTPFFQRIKALAWFDEVGATVMLHSIFAYSKKDFPEQTAKDSFVNYAQFGNFSVPQSNKTRMMFLKTISTLDDELCEYIYKNKEAFSNSIKAISPKINSIVESNKKFDDSIEKIINFINTKKS